MWNNPVQTADHHQMGDRRGVDAWASPEGKLALVPIHFVTGTGRAMDERLKRVIIHPTQNGSRHLWSFSPRGFLHYLHYLHCFLIVLVRCLSVKTPLFKCEVYFAGIVEGKRYMGVFPLFPLFPLFFWWHQKPIWPEKLLLLRCKAYFCVYSIAQTF